MARIIDAFTQFFDSAGDPLVNGKLHFLVSGTNNTDKNTYKNASMTIPNTNPVILDGDGRCPSVFGEGVYNVILYTPDGTQIQQFDPVGANSADGQLSPWTANNTYNSGDIVQGSDSEYYRSITNNNQNNNPETSATNWDLLKLGRVYNDNVTYSVGDSAYSSDGVLYVSIAGSNIANTPKTSPEFWLPSNYTNYSEASGGVDAITADFPISVVFHEGVEVVVKAAGGNTISNPTFSQDGDAAREIVKFGNQELSVGDIYGYGHNLILRANEGADKWELINPASVPDNSLSNLSPAGSKRVVTAWVNFDGTGTVTIRDSFNVSSVTDNGTGDYTVNFTTAKPDSNYAYSFSGGVFGGPSSGAIINPYSVSTSSIRISCANRTDGTGTKDQESVSVIIY